MSEEKGRTWMPVKMLKPDPRNVDPKAPALLVIEVPLAPNPPVGWAECFRERWDAGGHVATVAANVITLRVPDDEVVQYLDAVERTIAAANDMYASEVLPRIEAKRSAKEAKEAATEVRMEEARRKIRERDGG
jgi:hypothetical protein